MYLIFHIFITIIFLTYGAWSIKTKEFHLGIGRPPAIYLHFAGLSAIIIGVSGIVAGLVCLIPFVYCLITQTPYSPNARIFIGFGIFFPCMGLVIALFVKLGEYLENFAHKQAEKKKRS